MSTEPGDPPIQSTREPRYSTFTQQELPACKPLLTPCVVVALLVVVGAVFIPVGYACYQASASVVEVSQRYDDLCLQGVTAQDRELTLWQLGGDGNLCNVTLTAPKRMAAPVYMYYELDGFYQNHRRFVTSRSDPQLRGLSQSLASLKRVCDPQLYLGGHTSDVIDPCGLIAWANFNDTFQVMVSGAPTSVDDTNIAWETDVDAMFANVTASNFNTVPGLRGGGPINGSIQEDQHFISWMRTAALKNFRKLWGRVEQTIPAGTTITVTVQNRYNTYGFGGSKKLVFSTASWLGGKNPFLGLAFFVTGGASLAFAAAFVVLTCSTPRKVGDSSRLSWVKNR